jgi:hypothetical protein
MGSSRLYEFAKELGVPVSYFFDGMPSNAASGNARNGLREERTPFEEDRDPMVKRETLQLVRAYYRIH